MYHIKIRNIVKIACSSGELVCWCRTGSVSCSMMGLLLSRFWNPSCLFDWFVAYFLYGFIHNVSFGFLFLPNGGTQQYIVFNAVILENVGNRTENITSDILFDGVGQGLTSPLEIYLPDAKSFKKALWVDKPARLTIRVLWFLFLFVKWEVKKQIGRRWHCILKYWL